MPKSSETVLAFQQAIGRGDFAEARQLLSDDLEFSGPLDTFHKADDYLQAIQKLSTILERVDILKVFEDGDDVALFCELVTTTLGTSFVAEWYRIKNGRIGAVRVVFDPCPFAAMFSKHA